MTTRRSPSRSLVARADWRPASLSALFAAPVQQVPQKQPMNSSIGSPQSKPFTSKQVAEPHGMAQSVARC